MDRIERTLQAGHPDEPRYALLPADEIIRGPRTGTGREHERDARRRGRMALMAGSIALVLLIASAWVLTRRPSSDAVGVAEPSPSVSPSARSPRDCGPGDLTATFLRSRQTAARLSVWIRLEMRGATMCAVYGEPRVSVLSADGKPLLESRPSGAPNVDGAEYPWRFPPGVKAGGWIHGSNWCEDAGPPPYQLVIDEGPWQSDVLALDQLPPCIDASEPAWIQDVQTADTMEVPLPTLDVTGDVCRGIGVDGVLVGDPGDPRLAWLEGGDGSRRDLVWPADYQAQFSGPGLTVLAILDPRLTVILRAGDRITGGCVTQDPNVLRMAPSRETSAAH